MSFFKQNKRKIYAERFAEERTKAYETEFKKQLVKEAKAQAQKDSLTPSQRFKLSAKKLKKNAKKLGIGQGKLGGTFDP